MLGPVAVKFVWHTHACTTFLLGLGFQVGRASQCNFTHQARRIHLTVHEDDFTDVVSAKQIAWLGEAATKKHELKMEVLGPNVGQTEKVRVLNRIIHWIRTGLEREPDQRDAERIISELELAISSFRSNAVLSCRGQECICKNMARPCSEDWLAVKRVRERCRNSIGRVTTPISRVTPTQTGQETVSEHEVLKWWCDHTEWTLHKGLVDFPTSIGFELRRSRIVPHDKSDSSAQWRNQHGQRLWREFDMSGEIRLQQCNRNSSQRWLGRSVPTCQGAVLVDPVKDQRWRSQVAKSTWDEQRGLTP